MAEAGVPLACISELLGARPDRFAAALADIDRQLQQRADELVRTRERLARLNAGDRLFVSAAVADWSGDPRLEALAERSARWLAKRPGAKQPTQLSLIRPSRSWSPPRPAHHHRSGIA